MQGAQHPLNTQNDTNGIFIFIGVQPLMATIPKNKGYQVSAKARHPQTLMATI